MSKLSAALASLAIVALPAHAVVVTQWNFNSNPADGNTATGTLVPSTGTGTAVLIGGVTGSFASGVGSSDLTAVDNSGWQTTTYPAQGTADKTAGTQYFTSTAGYTDIVVSWDQRHSNTSSKYVTFQYTINGTNFLDVNPGVLFIAATGDTWFNNRTVDLTGVAGVANNPNFGFRIVSTYQPGTTTYLASTPGSNYGTAGTYRFDQVTISATVVPEPGTYALMLAGVLTMGFVARRRAR